MDELEIEGKRYLSSKRAAKLHKYHIDYIGQLIRGGKIFGRKVGRSWYVEESSLNSYLAQEAGEASLPVPLASPAPVVAEEVLAEEAAPEEIKEEVPPAPIAFASSLHAEPPMAMNKQLLHEAVRASEQWPQERTVQFSTPAMPAQKPSTLTYIEDSEPMLPVLEGRSRTNADFVAVPMRRVEAERQEDAYEEDAPEEEIITVERIRERRQRAFPRMEVFAIVALLVVIGAASVASAFLASSIKVSDGQAASVAYTFK